MKKLVAVMVAVTLMSCVMCAPGEQKPQISPTSKVVCGITPKVLQDGMVRALEIIFNDEPPLAVVRMILAYERAETVLKALQEYDKKIAGKELTEKELADQKAIVEKLMVFILKPVREFFVDLREFSTTLSPLIQESLDGRGNVVFEGSLLAKFLTTDKNKVNSFFEDNVKNKEDLFCVCKEFVILFGDLELTLPTFFKKAHDYIVQQKANKNATNAVAGASQR